MEASSAAEDAALIVLALRLGVAAHNIDALHDDLAGFRHRYQDLALLAFILTRDHNNGIVFSYM